METNDNSIVIGNLSANIAGDARYADRLCVRYCLVSRTVTVTVHESSAAGGMDGPGGTIVNDMPSFKAVTGARPCAKDVMALVKAALNDDRFLFKRYGKAKTRFAWNTLDGTSYGLSLSFVNKALEYAKAQCCDDAASALVA